jgi:hypothetical protein
MVDERFGVINGEERLRNGLVDKTYFVAAIRAVSA